MILEGLYSILLGVFLTFFVGIGINTFYPSSLYQEPASCMAPVQKDGTPSQSQEQCQKEIDKNQERTNAYSQNVSLISLIAAVIYVGIGFLVFRSTQLFSSGFLFGSIFTLLYSLARGLNSNNHVFAFIIVTISIVLVMAIGYLRFIRKSFDTTK
jgi:hypothetical protein